MKERYLPRWLFVCFITLILPISQGNLAYSKEARGVTKDSIIIGSIADHTGPTSNIGVLMVEAYKIFFRHINDEGGINGRKIKLVAEDSRYSIPASIAAFKSCYSRTRC